VALDCAAARDVLGWQASVGLEDGILRTVMSLRDTNTAAAVPHHAMR